MFLGQARGKVGDLVFYNMDGQQITRSRNRHPHNPRTPPQVYQRGIMASITAAYKAGCFIFDHSFQGKRKGIGCQREFSSRNARALRANVATDIDAARVGAEQRGRVVGPKTQTPVGFPGLIISSGTYPMTAFVFTPQVPESSAASWKLPPALTDETRAQYSERVGLIADDYYTFCGFAYAPELEEYAYIVPGHPGEEGAYQSVESFFFVRLGVKRDFVTSNEAVAGSTLGDIFVAHYTSPYISEAKLLAKAFSSPIEMSDIVNINDNTIEGHIGLIRSRLDMDLRSSSELVWGAESGYNGITSEFVLEAWNSETVQLGNSELVLEGGGF